MVTQIRICKRCGFILGTRPGLRDVDGICSACINTIGITEAFFDDMVDKHANRDLVVKDINGVWRRKDLI